MPTSSPGPGQIALPDEVLRRRATTTTRLACFKRTLDVSLRRERQRLLDSRTCVFVTGSGGRGELSNHSDLDVFIATRKPKYSGLDEILLKSTIIRTLAAAGFPPPSRDGEFLAIHSVSDLVRGLGSREEDSRNVLTARLLLLLESVFVAGSRAHSAAVDDVIDAYWKNVDVHQNDYLPIILANDIIRYWRIVLLNYESKNLSAVGDADADADRRLRSYKLRFSRCLTCFSAVSFLLAATASNGGHVNKKDVQQMVRTRPLDRLIWVAKRVRQEKIATAVQELIGRYATFLQKTDASEKTLIARFKGKAYRRDRSREGREFGEQMFAFIERLGRDNPLYRYFVV